MYPDFIYVPSSDTILICLINTGSGIPFISALELRPLSKSMYPIDSGAQFSSWRYDLGTLSDREFVRYREDVYDRLWYIYGTLNYNSVRINTSSVIDVHDSNDGYKLPAQVLRTAVQASGAYNNTLSFSKFGNSYTRWYVCFHFAEIAELTQGKKREFIISVNRGDYTSKLITLEYLTPLSICPNRTFESPFHFSIDATMESDLPPILNAFELYTVAPLPYKPTDHADVTAIMDIKRTFRISRDDWQGDPCVPHKYLWNGLTCSSDSTPRIITLNLSSSNLTGKIVTSFSDLTALQYLDLSYNSLDGNVPEFLAQLPNLKTLNLSGNQLKGTVPEALIQKSRNGLLVLGLGENSDLCHPVPCKKKEKKKIKGLIVSLAATSLVVLVLLLIFCALAIYKRKRRESNIKLKNSKMAVESNIKPKNQQYSYSEVVRITDNFNTIIGGGGFGKVYLGTLEETQVAVKLLSPSSNQGYKEFRAEAEILVRVHHRNLVSLIGYCDEGKNKALIYEYMANGNLHQYLSVTNMNVLNWNQRIQIAVDTAQGLEYLHNGCKPTIVHRDLKTTNILLNENMEGKIADFGLSRTFAAESDSHVSTRPAGTLGYLDPEFQASGNFNKKSDVYSYGIVLFELITGHPAIIKGPEENTHILDWVYPIIESGDIQNIIDARLHGEFHKNSAWKAVEIAMSCVPPVAIQRPDMSQVLVEIKECLTLEMAHERGQNKTTSNGQLVAASLELESDIAALAR
ncbi:LRR receptor-like serine/threonine-protein kinase IOS1 isoform X2 [Quercus robur]|uniref:LRR receptor-like serine/threonine-protein kinase IOS1 isoform X2 n=1 Tax=Quercus robur TaxID=38942 RepID=UPI0021623D8E|nr:LRR receptor-like serine/threonine-protein kinase IOS1 isoform X2 [Quercus robur]